MALDPDQTQEQDELALAEAKAESLAGGVEVPGYHLTHRLGSGTFGEVWAAVQESTGQEVAVKLLREGRARGWESSREMDRLKNVSEHPHIVTLLDADLDAQRPYLVMSLMRGSLASTSSTAAEVEKWFRQMVEALQFVHERGVLHCDLKPSNVLTDGTGNVRLADFGQAIALEQDSGALGSFGYMAPEQAQQPELPTVHWDVYGLGATTYRLLSGQVPRLTDDALREVATQKSPLSAYSQALRSAPLVPLRGLVPEIEPEFTAIVERCLELEPERRTQSMGAILEDLRRRQIGEPLLSRRPWTTSYLALSFARRHALALLAVILIVMGLVGAATVHYRNRAVLQSKLAAQYRERGRSLSEDGFGQQGLLWTAQALTLDPATRSPRFAIRHFRPALEMLVDHGSPPDTVSFSPGGQRFASCSGSQLRLWSLAGELKTTTEGEVSGEASVDKPYLRTLPRLRWTESEHPRALLTNKSVSLGQERPSEKTRVLASNSWGFVYATDEGLFAWDGSSRDRLAQGKNPVSLAGLTPSGEMVALYGERELSVWDRGSGEKLWSEQLEVEVTHLSMSTDTIALCCADNSIRLLEVDGGRLRAKIESGRWAVYSTAFHPSGDWLYGCDSSGKVRIWDSHQPSSEDFSVRHRWLVYGVEFSSNGQQFVTFSVDGTARVWSCQKGQPLTPFLDHRVPVRCASFDASGERLVTGSIDGLVRIYRLTEKSLSSTQQHPGLAVTGLSFLADSSSAVVSLGAVQQEGTLSRPGLRTGPGSGAVVRYTEGGSAAQWTYELGAPATALEVSPDGQTAFVGCADGTLVGLKTSNGEQYLQTPHPGERVGSLAVSTDGKRLAVALFSGKCLLYEVDGQVLELIASLEHQGQEQTTQTTHPTHVEFDPSGQHLLTALGDERVNLWRARDGSLVRSLQLQAPSRMGHFSANGEYYATFTDNGRAEVWKTGEGHLVAGPFQQRIAIWDGAFRPDGKHLATVSGDSTCQVWDLEKGTPAFPALEHGAPVVRVRYSQDGRWLLSGAKDGAARLWDARTGELVSVLLDAESPAFALAFSSDNNFAAVGSGDGLLQWSGLSLDLKSSTAHFRREAQRKTGLELRMLPSGASEIKALDSHRWQAL